MNTPNEWYMQRCITLAEKGAGSVAPNPMVGAVLVYQDQIIGEGWHEQFGSAHAEVQCIKNAEGNGYGHLLPRSVMYVSLEPCTHHGKTPPCSDLIIRKKIPRVIIGCRDPFVHVNGKGIEKLRNAGVEVEEGVLEQACRALNKRFFTFHQLHRPYIILKWAQTSDGFIASNSTERLLISNELSNKRVHLWRSEEAAILVGSKTALKDNPILTNRLGNGAQPIRLLLDRYLQLPPQLYLLSDTMKTIIFNTIRQETVGTKTFVQLKDQTSILQEMLDVLYQMNIQSVLVEGGATLINQFIAHNLWDEARVITNRELEIKNGLSAPLLKLATRQKTETVLTDRIDYFTNPLLASI
ncbi:MAG: bifunctional diaminohydroxyphosphoribosylaminopyrimidine deaminase/5-amino-6-(5-phosphoribosylamino)uracil reductase RibD [Lacibacter sp.]